MIMKFLLIIFVLIDISWAETSCLKVFTPKETPEMFKQEAPIILEVAGKKYPISFSSDGEVPWNEVAKFLYAHPQTLANLKKEGMIPQVEGKHLAAYTGLKESQITSPFVLRQGVKPNQKTYYLSDLNPFYFATTLEYMPNLHLHFVRNFFVTEAKKLPEIIAKVMRDEGIPVKGIYDGGFIEFTHASYERSPKQFNHFLKNQLHRVFPNSSTHLHLGIPAAAVTNTQFLSIARAVEVKSIFTLAMRDLDNGLQELPFRDSLLLDVKEYATPMGYDFEGRRGVIRAQTSEWTKPFNTHNLELRQYDEIEDGLELLELATKMAQQAKKIKYIYHRQKKVNDPYTQNLHGALLYASKLFKDSPDINLQKIGKKMEDLVNESQGNPVELTMPMRKKIREFLIDNDIQNLLNLKLFLKE
jgi:hypothetical protein